MKNIHDWFNQIYPVQQAASKDRFERFEGLACAIDDSIKAAITAFNAQERARGFLMPATPDEINKALAEAVAMHILAPTDEVGLEEFIENPRELDDLEFSGGDL